VHPTLQQRRERGQKKRHEKIEKKRVDRVSECLPSLVSSPFICAKSFMVEKSQAQGTPVTRVGNRAGTATGGLGIITLPQKATSLLDFRYPQ